MNCWQHADELFAAAAEQIAAAGIVAGDVVVSVNSLPATANAGLCARLLVEGAPGTRLALHLARGDKITVELAAAGAP